MHVYYVMAQAACLLASASETNKMVV